MADLTNFVGRHKAVPDDEDKPFIVEFERSEPHVREREFRFFVSTPRLLRLASNSNNIHADATHKVTLEKLPLLVIGTTDAQRSFHMIGIAISSHETGAAFAMAFKAAKEGIKSFAEVDLKPDYLVADGDIALHNGFRAVFGENAKILMCYAHVVRNVKMKYKFINSKTHKKAMLDDIRTLHLAIDENSFDVGVQLFVSK